MKKIYILFICIYLAFNLYAKKNFKPAIVVIQNSSLLSNDTLKGYADFRSEYLNAIECKFKLGANDSERIFTPEQIVSYKFLNEGNYYVSRNISTDSTQSNKVFLELLVQGAVNLYFYKNLNNTVYYYFEKADGELIEISKRSDKISNVRFKVENTWYSSTNNYDRNLNDEGYKEKMHQIFRSPSPLSRQIEKANFNRENFIDITSSYNELTNNANVPNIVFARNSFNAYFKLDFSLQAAMQYSSYSSTPSSLVQNLFIESRSILPTIGSQLLFTSPRISKSLGLIVDLSLSPFAGACDYVGKYDSYFRYEYNALKFGAAFGLKYTYVETKFQPFVEATIANSFFVSKSSKLDIYDRYFSHEVKTDYLLPEDVISGYRVAMGGNYLLKNNQKVFVKIAYEKLSDYKDNVLVYELQLGLTF